MGKMLDYDNAVAVARIQVISDWARDGAWADGSRRDGTHSDSVGKPIYNVSTVQPEMAIPFGKFKFQELVAQLAGGGGMSKIAALHNYEQLLSLSNFEVINTNNNRF